MVVIHKVEVMEGMVEMGVIIVLHLVHCTEKMVYFRVVVRVVMQILEVL